MTAVPGDGPAIPDDRRFGPIAARLAGQTALLFGWSPHRFWHATPAELAAITAAAAAADPAAPGTGGIDRQTLKTLMEQDRDG
ncbi:phage tail assembly chaperone [Novosphingobium sp.]|uniref:phage tail assembly chaperone n=1 Tax=Novosphingobium sp. TaxID=1874826 RepID=UPI0038BDCF18